MKLTTSRKQELIDKVIESLKHDFAVGDNTVLEEILTFVPDTNLVQSLDEDEWENYPEVKIW